MDQGVAVCVAGALCGQLAFVVVSDASSSMFLGVSAVSLSEAGVCGVEVSCVVSANGGVSVGVGFSSAGGDALTTLPSRGPLYDI